MLTYTTYPVAAARYLSKSTGRPRTHVVVMVDGDAARVLCTRVRMESILFDGALAEAPEAATCHQCIARYRKIILTARAAIRRCIAEDASLDTLTDSVSEALHVDADTARHFIKDLT